MTLSLVLGPANSAKAGAVLEAYAVAARRDALLIVPTAADVLHYQRELAAPGVTLGRTLTFSGLIDEIATRTGHRAVVLTALQRERVLRRSIASVSLDSLAASASSGGFVRAAGRLIEELGQQRVSPARFGSALRTWATGSSERLSYGSELAAIHRRYLVELEQLVRVDAEMFAWGALDALRERPVSWGSTPVFIYGFDDLTPIELDAVETLSRQVGARVTVSLTYEPDRPALAARASVVQELRALAGSVIQLPGLDDHYLPQSRAALHHLERFVFEPGAPTLDPGDAVTLLEAAGERAEAELVAAEVLRALAEGVPKQEIVIVCRALAGAGRFERALERYGIPAASARRVPLAHTALGRALLALTRYALAPRGRRSISDLIAYLHHPGVVEDTDTLDRVEADIRRAGLRELDASGPQADALRPALAAIDQLARERDPLVALPDHVRRLMAAPYRGSAALLTAEQRLDGAAAAAVLDSLAQLAGLQEERPPSAAELIDLLEGIQVPVHGQAVAEQAVLVSDPGAIRARRFRRVFVTGLCEGEFPSPQTGAGNPFLDDERRRELALATGLVLPPRDDRLERERYLFYACISRATERVTFSYRSSDEDGNLIVPSPFVDDVAELLDAGWRGRRRRRLLADVAWDVEEAPSDRDRVVASVFAQAVRSTARAAGAGPATRTLSPGALQHVRHSAVVSASALEAFAACPVSWLVQRQLQCRDLEPQPEPMLRGALIHSLLERVISGLQGPLSPASLPAAERALHQAIAAGEHVIAVGRPAEVRLAVLRGVEAELRRYLRDEASGGCDWPPAHVELRFGLDGQEPPGQGVEPSGELERPAALPPLELTDGEERILVSGVVDRVDADPADLTRVIVRDYKSGSRRDSWPGLRWLADDQLQVAIYMLAVERLLGRQAVAGFYQPLAGQDIRPRGVYEEGVPVGENVLSRDALGAAELRALLQEIELEAVRVGATLRRGELKPCPETCSSGGCRHPGICWSDEAEIG
jgi:RecB family exonuclease